MSNVDGEICDNWENCDFKWKKSFRKNLIVLCEHVENKLLVNELEYGLENYYSREKIQQAPDQDDYETEVHRN